MIGDLDPLPTALRASFSKRKIITVGEMHGTEEAPAFTAGLVRLLAAGLKSVLLAIELETDSQSHVEKFLKSGDSKTLLDSPFFKKDFRDGRTSVAMVALLEKVRKISNVKVLCFDPGQTKSDQERDSKMAGLLRDQIAKLNPSMTVVLAGNIHAAAAKGVPWDPEFRPMGYELFAQKGSKIKRSDILSVQVRHSTGTAWVCLKDKPCESAKMNMPPDVYATATPVNRYFLLEGDSGAAYDAVFFTRKITASPPYKDSGQKPD